MLILKTKKEEVLISSGDNTEKIWAHRFLQNKKHMPKACKMAAGSPGSTVGLPEGVRGQALKG